MTDKEKLEKLKKLADAMYDAAQYLTTDASRLHKAMDEYRKFIIYECKEEPVSKDLEEAANFYANTHTEWFDADNNPHVSPAFKAGAQWQKDQMMAKAKSGTVQKDNQVILDNGTYIDLDPSMQLKPSFVGLKEGDRIKVVIIKED